MSICVGADESVGTVSSEILNKEEEKEKAKRRGRRLAWTGRLGGYRDMSLIPTDKFSSSLLLSSQVWLALPVNHISNK
jgi:hypothetical protein